MVKKERTEEAVRQGTKNATLFSRHSRFGGTFLFQPQGGERFPIHKDVALVRNGLNLDVGKKPLTKTFRAVDYMDVRILFLFAWLLVPWQQFDSSFSLSLFLCFSRTCSRARPTLTPRCERP